VDLGRLALVYPVVVNANQDFLKPPAPSEIRNMPQHPGLGIN